MGNSPSSPPEVRIVTSRTLPQPVVDEINTWLCNNIIEIVNGVAEKHFEGRIEVKKTKSHEGASNLAYRVFKSKAVRLLPVYINVANTARHVVIGYIERKMMDSTKRTTSVYFKCGKQTYVILLSDVEKKLNSNSLPSAGDGYETQPELVQNAMPGELIKAQTTLDHPADYWKIINEADAYDKNPGRFIQALKRAESKWGADKTLWHKIFAGVVVIPANFSERLKGVEKAAETQWGKLHGDQASHKGQLYRMMPNLVPIASTSEAVRDHAVIENKKRESKHHYAKHRYSDEVLAVLQNDRCFRFWNARYLFNLDGKDGTKGVAIDTITGVVSDVDFRYAHDRWECEPSSASTKRWDRFCKGDHGSFRWDQFRTLTRDMWVKFDPEKT